MYIQLHQSLFQNYSLPCSTYVALSEPALGSGSNNW